MRISLWFALGFFLVFSCGKEDPLYDVHPEFEKYVDRFISEGENRGIAIDFSDTGLSIVFRQAVDTETGGVCRGDHQIEIEKFFWDDLNDHQREGLIFHELGHCELGRGHRNDLLNNGEWASRMRGSPIPDSLSSIINYSGIRREYYIDELFDMLTPAPEWADIRADYDEINISEKEVILIVEEQRAFQESINLPFEDDFEIEFIVDAGFSESWVGIQWAGNEINNSLRVLYNNQGEFYIDSGSQVFGPMRHIKFLELLNDNDNKITVRRQSDKYYVFVNETFVYWFDYIFPASSEVRSLVVGPTPAMFHKFSISKI